MTPDYSNTGYLLHQ